MINAIIFDLDGTLLNTLEDLTDSVNFALKKFDYPAKTTEDIKNALGEGVNVLFQRILPEGENNKNFDKIIECFKNHYKDNLDTKTKPYDGIMEVLHSLKMKGVLTAVVSNKFDTAVKQLCKKYFGDLITVALGENEIEGVRKKPAPDNIFKALEYLRVTIEHIIYAGDSEIDVQTAHNAEIECIACAWGFRDKSVLQRAGAKYIVDRPSEILDIIYRRKNAF